MYDNQNLILPKTGKYGKGGRCDASAPLRLRVQMNGERLEEREKRGRKERPNIETQKNS